MLGKLNDYAPGVRDAIPKMTVSSLLDLEAHNSNLVGGDNGGGSHHLARILFPPAVGLVALQNSDREPLHVRCGNTSGWRSPTPPRDIFAFKRS
jgi:phytoene dehydrogenase-like protein